MITNIGLDYIYGNFAIPHKEKFMNNTLNAAVKVKHFGYGFTVTPNGNIQMRLPIKHLKKGDIIVGNYDGGHSIVVERLLENVEVTMDKIISD